MVPLLKLIEASPFVVCGTSTVWAHLCGRMDLQEQVRVFRTGDVGKLSPYGLQLAGRLDLQAKIGGALALLPALGRTYKLQRTCAALFQLPGRAH